MAKYYVDSCIWLNLLNKEQAKVQGLPVWKIAEEFLRQKEQNILLSKCVRKEVLNKINNEKEILFLDNFQEIAIHAEELAFAREIEFNEQYKLSFFDCIHIAVSKNRNYILISRDQELIWRGEKYVTIKRPEDMLY